ncbi:MAG: hypothetical protein WBN51_11690 [Gammaproteobacteria bacterium]
MKSTALLIAILLLPGCTTIVGTTVGVVTTVAVETAKVPFKVAGAVVDVVTDEDENETD